ncbi:DUF1127 domain-containing protein [Roseovarius salis]|uniref:DUF1127 domain-containing protein n=1 Tax=Roseovarius salis TaxID=3376063 RepID=UPI0037C98574
MAVIDTPRNVSAVGVSGGLFRLFTLFGHWIEARRTRKALSKLSDRELDDIGLTRGDIKRLNF